VKEALRSSLATHLGARVRPLDDGRLFVAPADEAELKMAIAHFRSHGASLRKEAVLSRRGLAKIGTPSPRTALVEVEAGATLDEIDRAVSALELTIGPVSPAARALALGEFLEGPYAGVRAVLGGRLEPMVISLEAVLESGLVFRSRPCPRSAAGPDLDALLLGGEGRLGWISRALVRLLPRPAALARSTSSYSDARALTRAARRALAAGCDVQRGFVQRRAGRYVLELELGGSPETIERDRSTCAQLASDAGGRASGQEVDVIPPGEERELGWEDLAGELDAGTPISLHRLSVDAVIAIGTTRGQPLVAGGWPHEETFAALAQAALEPGDPGGGG
jgi:FAD/FMN-containing dehydrogenase